MRVTTDPARQVHSLGKVKTQRREFVDEVACISVPSTFVLCRYRGTTFVSGQTLNFAKLYGAGDDKLAQDFGVTLAEARQISHAVMAAFSGMAAFIQRRIQEMRHDCVMVTLGGRNRTIREIQSAEAREFAEGERLVTNQSCQAGARDILTGAMIQADLDIEAGGGYGTFGRGSYGTWHNGLYVPDAARLPKLWEDGLTDVLRENLGLLGRVGARMINQIHDELLLATPEAYAQEVRQRVVAFMQDPWGRDLVLRVPLVAEGTIGRTWKLCKEAKK